MRSRMASTSSSRAADAGGGAAGIGPVRFGASNRRPARLGLVRRRPVPDLPAFLFDGDCVLFELRRFSSRTADPDDATVIALAVRRDRPPRRHHRRGRPVGHLGPLTRTTTATDQRRSPTSAHVVDEPTVAGRGPGLPAPPRCGSSPGRSTARSPATAIGCPAARPSARSRPHCATVAKRAISAARAARPGPADRRHGGQIAWSPGRASVAWSGRGPWVPGRSIPP